MPKAVENKIRINAVLIYALIIVICTGGLLYIVNFHGDVNRQRERFEQTSQELSQIDRLVHSINQAQTEANLYASTKRIRYLNAYKENIVGIEHLMDSIRGTRDGYDDLFNELIQLLNEKSRVLSELNKRFSLQNPLEPVNEIFQNYVPTDTEDSLIISSVVQDTTINLIERKNIWGRIANVFSPDTSSQDTVITTSVVVDTLKVFRIDSLQAATELHDIIRQAQEEYDRQIAVIGGHVNRLIVADQEISKRISDLMIGFYSDNLSARLDRIQKNEQSYQRNNTITIVSGITALILILAFVFLIISGANKGLRTRKALEEANRLTRQLMESRHQLLLAVSHDIKTPLNSILGYLELRKTGELSEKDAAAMRNSGKYILALLENLLEYSALEQGTLYVSESDFKLHGMYSDVMDMFLPLAHRKELSFDCEADFDDHLILHADQVKIKQIIINILSNAVKYTRSGGIRFTMRYREGELAVTVSDTGAGIPPKQLDNIFKPFTRIDENNSLAEGTGLGMFVVKGLADLLGGRITIDSEPDKGTEVKVFIPAGEGGEKKFDTPANILLIDDDLSFLTMLGDMCTKLGHSATLCNTSIEFDQQVRELSGFDLVLTDMEMGIISGTDVLRRVRKAGFGLPVYVMSGRSDIDERKASEMGFSGYLRKPVALGSIELLVGGKTEENADFDWMQEDRELVDRILEVFVPDSLKNAALLEEAVTNGDFAGAQSLCHKMLPMFMQFGAEDIVPVLQKMDSLRGAAESSFPDWKETVSEMTGNIKRFLETLREEYTEA